MFSATDQRGGNITKSAMDIPGLDEQQLKTVKIEGSLKKKQKI